ncbi:VOC family protein [Halomonas sp. NCCP-2165]|nr:VOC family protein [Halomonas sp. NCCP-2165]GKW50280.1 virulence protein [Halomonas sp. NCCP-2165]
MLAALDHLLIPVSDLPRAVDFYSRVLGLDVRYRDAGRVDLLLDGLALRLLDPARATDLQAATPTPGSQALCLRSRLPLDEIRRHLDALGIPLEQGPVSGLGAAGPIEALYLRDPEGNLLEICRPAN